MSKIKQNEIKPLSYFERYIEHLLSKMDIEWINRGLINIFDYEYIINTQYNRYLKLMKQHKKINVDMYLNINCTNCRSASDLEPVGL